MQSVTKGQGMHDDFPEIGIQRQNQRGIVQTKDRSHASDSCSSTISR